MISTSVVADGSLLLAIPVAAAAGLVSFLSPCVLPLVPGYLSYITGLTGADLGIVATAAPTRVPATVGGGGSVAGSEAPGSDAGPTSTDGGDSGSSEAGATVTTTAVAVPPALSAVTKSSRVLLGTLGFVAGFSVIFISYGALFGALGGALLVHQEAITRVMGVVVILLGLAFMGFLPGMTREYRFHRAPRIGIWSAPLLGALFGLGWTPCIGPTLAAVQTLAFTEGSALRGAVLSLAYCVGLGVPFVLLGLAFRRLAGTLSWVRGHYLLVMRIGGAMLIVIGLLLVTGLWSDLMILMRTWTGSFEVPL